MSKSLYAVTGFVLGFFVAGALAGTRTMVDAIQALKWSQPALHDLVTAVF
jgi:hypothetical protein